jgi:hypothetical protein
MDLEVPDQARARVAENVAKGIIKPNELKTIADSEEIGTSTRSSVWKVFQCPCFWRSDVLVDE